MAGEGKEGVWGERESVPKARPCGLPPRARPAPTFLPPHQHSITRLYVRDACLSLRDNNLGFQSYKEFTCPAATNVGGTTCANAFATAPPDSILNAATAAGTSNGATFDGDNVCANKDTGYIYVLNMCNEPVRLTFEVKTRPYAGPLCLRVLGKQLSPIAIMVCVAGALVALIALGLLCCCCVRCCLR